VTVEAEGEETVVKLEARGNRVRLRPEAQAGLRGEPMGEGLPGQWVQTYYLQALVADSGGKLDWTIGEELIEISARLPNHP
jgi:histidine phosphotransferase ChpT